MDNWIIYVIGPVAVALVTWLIGRNGRRIDETSKIVGLLQDEIGRLAQKVEQLESKLQTKEIESERKSMIIQEAFKCRTPYYKCPVLIKQNFFNQQKYNNEQRIEEPQPREYSSEQDDLHGGGDEQRPGL